MYDICKVPYERLSGTGTYTAPGPVNGTRIVRLQVDTLSAKNDQTTAIKFAHEQGCWVSRTNLHFIDCLFYFYM